MKKKILIIEDDVDLQKIYKSYFEKAGLLVSMADNGLKWITKILENPPDIIMLDVLMPQMNGIEFLETIKNQSSIKIPTVVCSSLTKQGDIDNIYRLWADLFINKFEYKIQDLVEKVTSYIK